MTLHRRNTFSSSTDIDPLRWYDPGNPGPAVSTDDYYHTCGMYWFRSHDLRQWGSHGAAMETLHGHRYFWSFGPDHPVENYAIHRASSDFKIGFSHDPGIFPDVMRTVVSAYNLNTNVHPIFPAGTVGAYEYTFCTYNPEDPDAMPFYMAMEGAGVTATPNQHFQILFRSNNLIDWVAKVVSHPGSTLGHFTSFHAPQRWAAGDWRSQGLGGTDTNITFYRWTSTDGMNFTMNPTQLTRYRHHITGATYTRASLPIVRNHDISEYASSATEAINIDGTYYLPGAEYVGVYLSLEFQKPGYVTIFKFDPVTGNMLDASVPIRLDGPYDGKFPGPGWVQDVNCTQEDGIAHIYSHRSVHGPVNVSILGWPFAVKKTSAGSGNGVVTTFSATAIPAHRPLKPKTCIAHSKFSNLVKDWHDDGNGNFVGSGISGTVNYATGAFSVIFTAPPDNGYPVSFGHLEDKATMTRTSGSIEDGGGAWESFIDYHTYVFNPTLAAQAAPSGVMAKCNEGVVTLNWYNAQAANRRIYRGDASSQTELLGTTDLETWTDASPPAGQVWYKVQTVVGSTLHGFRVVHCYVSDNSELTNKHVNRVIDDGGMDSTIKKVKLEQAVTFLSEKGWTNDLLFWAAPDFGIKEVSGAIKKAYCLGTTQLPRGGDLTFRTTNTIYQENGISSTCSAFANTTSNAFSHFGGDHLNFNPIRKKRQITIAFLYARTQTATDITLLGMNTNVGAMIQPGGNSYIGAEVNGLSIVHKAGDPGVVEFMMKDDNYGIGTRFVTASVIPASTAAYYIVVASYDGNEMTVHCNGLAGTPNPNYDPNPHFLRSSVLAGSKGAQQSWPILGVGSRQCSYTRALNSPSYTPGTYVFPNNEAQFKGGHIFVMGRGVNAAQALELHDLFQEFVTGESGVPAPLRWVIPIGFKGNMDIQNLRTDWGAEADGVDDDADEFKAYAAYAAALPNKQHKLILDSGYTFLCLTGQFWTRGVRHLTVEGTGAIVTCPSPGVYDFGSGVVGMLDAAKVALINSVDRGSYNATLKSAVDGSKFTVGSWVCISGLRTQSGGEPANMAVFEHIKVISVVDTLVTFDRPLRQSYKDTWPDDGAARIFISTDWDQFIRHVGYSTISNYGGHTRSRDVRFRNMDFDYLTPTVSSTVFCDNSTMQLGGPTNTMEPDKLIEVLRFRNSTIHIRMFFQSSAPTLVYLDGSRFDYAAGANRSIDGTPRHLIVKNGSYIERLSTSCYYGVTKSIHLQDSYIGQLIWGAGSYDRGGDASLDVSAVYFMTDGVIRMPKAVRTSRPNWAIPGTVAFFGYVSIAGTRIYGPAFKILGVTSDASNYYVTTNLVGTWPTVPGGVIKAINTHPCPKLTVDNCTGSLDITDLSNFHPDGAPALTYSRRTYGKADTTSQKFLPALAGRIMSIEFDVTLAWDDDALALTAQVLDIYLLTGVGGETRYNPTINLRTQGKRTVSLSAPPVSFTGDTGLTPPSGAWFSGTGGTFNASRNVSGITGDGFAITITIITDQGVIADDELDYGELVAMAEVLN